MSKREPRSGYSIQLVVGDSAIRYESNRADLTARQVHDAIRKVLNETRLMVLGLKPCPACSRRGYIEPQMMKPIQCGHCGSSGTIPLGAPPPVMHFDLLSEAES